MTRGQLRMLARLSQLPGWFTPTLTSDNAACLALHRDGYLNRRPATGARFEYRVNKQSPRLQEARALGIVQ